MAKHNSPPAPSSPMQQLSVASDGRIKAVFVDNHVLVLSSGGTLFAYVDEDGRVTRQTSEFVVSAYAERLCLVLTFRNMHLDTPAWCHAMGKRDREATFTLGYPLSSVCWPASLDAAAETNSLQRYPDGRVAVQSEDSTARLVMHPHAKRFAVCFPLLVSRAPSPDGQACKYTYAWQTQMFTVSDFPQRWAAPVRLVQAALLRVAPPAAAPLATLQPAPPAGGGDSPALERAPQLSQGSDGGGGGGGGGAVLVGADVGPQFASVTERTSHLPHALDPPPESPQFFEPNSWWTECALDVLPDSCLLQMQWTPDAFIQFLPSSGEVEVWLSEDESCLSSFKQCRFFHHLKAAGAPDCVYAAHALPLHAWTSDGSRRYELAPVATRACAFRARAVAFLEEASERADAPDGHAAPEVLSNDVKEAQDVDDVGSFTAFVDGRVRVRFVDRTLVSIDRWHRTASLLLPDGTRNVVSVEAPHGAAEYVHAAMEFAGWAFASVEDRQAAADAARQVAAGLSATQRMLALCDHSLTRTVPVSNVPRVPSPDERSLAPLAICAAPRSDTESPAHAGGGAIPRRSPESVDGTRDAGRWRGTGGGTSTGEGCERDRANAEPVLRGRLSADSPEVFGSCSRGGRAGELNHEVHDERGALPAAHAANGNGIAPRLSADGSDELPARGAASAAAKHGDSPHERADASGRGRGGSRAAVCDSWNDTRRRAYSPLRRSPRLEESSDESDDDVDAAKLARAIARVRVDRHARGVEESEGGGTRCRHEAGSPDCDGALLAVKSRPAHGARGRQACESAEGCGGAGDHPWDGGRLDAVQQQQAGVRAAERADAGLEAAPVSAVLSGAPSAGGSGDWGLPPDFDSVVLSGGDRDALVTHWLQRNAEMLARLH